MKLIAQLFIKMIFKQTRSNARSFIFFRKMKKSQIKMFENIGVMIVFFFLLAFGLVFYGNYQKRSLINMQYEFNLENAIKTSKRVSYMPELQCSETQAGNCIDSYKLESFKNVIGDAEDYYYNIFGKSTVSIEQLYPITKSSPLYDSPMEEGQRYSTIKSIIPVSIYNPVDRKYYYGVLNVSVYIRR